MTKVHIVDLDARFVECWYCGKAAPNRWGLPVVDGRLVPVDYDGDWGNVPACQECHDLHDQGLLPQKG